MKKIIGSIFLIAFTVLSFSQTKNFIDQPYIEIRSKADTLISPDKIYLNITLLETDSKGKIDVEKLENKMATKLSALGIDLKNQLFLNDFGSNFKRYFLKKKDILKSKNFTLVVYNSYTAGKVIMELEKINISNIEFQKAEYSKFSEMQFLLKKKAVVKAKNEATALLKPLNQQLGKALFISDVNTRIYNNLQGRVAGIKIGYSEMENSEPLNINFDKIKIESEIFVKFKIE